MDLKNTEVKEIARYFSYEVNNFLFKAYCNGAEKFQRHARLRFLLD